MTQPVPRSRTFHYRRAEIVGGENRSLSELLADALSRELHPAKRGQRLGEENDDVRLVNRPYREGPMICGCFLLYTEGGHQPIIELDDEKLELAIQALPPGEKKQFVAGTLFFGIQDDHVILMQSHALRSAEFEHYLNWLLKEKTGIVPEGAAISLLPQPSQKAKEKIGGVQSVTLRAQVSLDRLRSAAEQKPKSSVVGAVTNRLWASLSERSSFLESLKEDDALAVDDIEVSLEIKRKSRRKDAPPLLDELAHALRHSDNDVFELKTKSGTVLKSGDLRLAVPRSVKTIDRMPVLADVARKMHDWLAELIDQRQVEEEG